jgi:hypothetical protein
MIYPWTAIFSILIKMKPALQPVPTGSAMFFLLVQKPVYFIAQFPP